MSAKPQTTTLPDQALVDALRLIRSENVGPVTYHNLVSFYGSPARALEALPELSRRGGKKRTITIYEAGRAEAEIEAVMALGARMISSEDEAYPALLKEAPDAPPVLCVLGNANALNHRPVLGMVGARNASANGFAFAKKIAHELGHAGYVIASGLARGIDTAAHQGSLETGTIAVIAGGVDHVYPPENASLYHAIQERGCIISEAPLGTAPIARHFPARNRIIAGMSKGLIVTEASLKSGSLITARDALDYGRDVFAVPGSPLDPRCKGSNDLIRNGATLTESATDVLDNLNTTIQPGMLEPDMIQFTGISSASPAESELDSARSNLLEKLGPDAVLLDELLAQCNTTPNILYTVLLELELAGRLIRHSSGKVSLRMEVE